MDKCSCQKNQIIIFLIDHSGSMDGIPMESVNKAMNKIIKEFSLINSYAVPIQLEMAILSFGGNVQWKSGDVGYISPSEFIWDELDAEGDSPIGHAFEKLHIKLKETNLSEFTSNVPIIILITDGNSTDDYLGALNDLKNDYIFRISEKIAIYYGNSKEKILGEFVINPNRVFGTDNPELLEEIIIYLSISVAILSIF